MADTNFGARSGIMVRTRAIRNLWQRLARSLFVPSSLRDQISADSEQIACNLIARSAA